MHRAWFVLVLVLPLLGVATAQDPANEWSFDDGVGDQTMEVGPSPELVPNPQDPSGLAPQTDLRKVVIADEDEAGFSIDLFVRKLTLGASMAAGGSDCPLGSSQEFEVDFDLAGPEPFRYIIHLALLGDYDYPGGPVFKATGARACLEGNNGTAAFRANQRVEANVVAIENRIHVWVPKASLTGGLPLSQLDSSHFYPDLQGKWPLAVNRGDRLEHIVVRSRSMLNPSFVPMGVVVADIAKPITERSYTFQRPSANSVVKVRLEDAADRLPVRVAGNQSLAFIVANGAAGRRILSLDYDFRGSDERLPAYVVTGPARVTIPAGESRKLFATLHVASEARTDDGVTLAVRAISAGFPDEVGLAQAVLVPSPHLGPDADTLYALMRHKADCKPTVKTAGECDEPFLSPLSQDPSAVAGEDQPYGVGFGTKPETVAEGGAATLPGTDPTPVLFDPSRPVHAELVFSSNVAVDKAQVQVTVNYGNETGELKNRLMEATKTMDLPAGTTKLVIDGRVRLSDPFLPRGTRFGLNFRFTADPSAAVLTSFVQQAAPSFFLKSKDTFVRFPLLELPPILRQDVVESPFQLANQGVPEDFVNPGKGHLFNVTLLNQGGQRYRADLTTSVDRADWTLRVLPGHRFELEPGDALRLGLLVSAPADVAEGVRAHMSLNVTDPMGHVVTLRFSVLVVTQVELADDSSHYRADADATGRLLTTAKKDTPGPGAAISLSAVLVGAWWMRQPRVRSLGRHGVAAQRKRALRGPRVARPVPKRPFPESRP